MEVFIQTETNHYHDSVSVGEVYSTALKAKTAFDKDHDHDEEDCDYCKAKWKRSATGWIKSVDHDGAEVDYEVLQERVK